MNQRVAFTVLIGNLGIGVVALCGVGSLNSQTFLFSFIPVNCVAVLPAIW